MRLIIRAVFANGESALDRTILILDDTAPRVTLLDPKEGSRFNGTVPMLGTAQDENGVDGVGVAIRKGDKAAYEVPSFIQGLYLDLHGLGATW